MCRKKVKVTSDNSPRTDIYFLSVSSCFFLVQLHFTRKKNMREELSEKVKNKIGQ